VRTSRTAGAYITPAGPALEVLVDDVVTSTL
jgi:hypothetical protein